MFLRSWQEISTKNSHSKTSCSQTHPWNFFHCFFLISFMHCLPRYPKYSWDQGWVANLHTSLLLTCTTPDSLLSSMTDASLLIPKILQFYVWLFSVFFFKLLLCAKCFVFWQGIKEWDTSNADHWRWGRESMGSGDLLECFIMERRKLTRDGIDLFLPSVE